MVRNADSDPVATGDEDVRNTIGSFEQYGYRPREESLAERTLPISHTHVIGRGRYLGKRHRYRPVARATLRLENAADRFGIKRVRPEPVDGFGRINDEVAPPDCRHGVG